MRTKIIALIISTLIISACKNEKKEIAKEVEETVEVEVKKVKLKLEPKSNSNVTGNVVFTDENGKVSMTAILSGLKPGSHAIHLHEKADCSSEDGTSTGGHWNPTSEPHGKWGASEGYHKGDIGNFEADENGNGTITFTTEQWCIGCGDPNKDILGKAVIVHEGTDDYTTQPTGAAGGRVSCAALIE
ncbi:MAG: superoxide dismutase family protein [Bacteroidia bacterium]|nr:superoxide dismutase family protein [Bacteroidia bacterium]